MRIEQNFQLVQVVVLDILGRCSAGENLIYNLKKLDSLFNKILTNQLFMFNLKVDTSPKNKLEELNLTK